MATRDSCADITTRTNLQLRDIPLDDATGVMQALHELGPTTLLESDMGDLRNVVGSPLLAGIDNRPVLVAAKSVHTTGRQTARASHLSSAGRPLHSGKTTIATRAGRRNRTTSSALGSLSVCVLGLASPRRPLPAALSAIG